MNTLANIKKLTNETRTENYDIALKSTFNSNLDLLGLMGGMRYNTSDLLNLFQKAYYEDSELAIRNLFYLRDVRGGMGERKAFREILNELAKNNPEGLKAIIKYIPEYGRWDDILLFLDYKETKDETLRIITEQLREDMASDNPSLLAKWLPSVNASSKKTKEKAVQLCKFLNVKESQYRKMLSNLRKKINVLEVKLSNKEYDFDYSTVPSNAMSKYRAAFYRNDEERFVNYLDSLTKGEDGVKVNVKTLFPHEIIKPLLILVWDEPKELEEHEYFLIESQWKAMERSTTDSNTIVVRDGSGSMYGQPMEIANALSILYSEQLTGEFKDTFITFSRSPELVSLSHCKTLKDKVGEVMRYDDMSNTDIYKTYKLILNASINVAEEDRIDRIVIISDMEFDYGADFDASTYEQIKSEYALAGIKMPEIVYWNVGARSIHFPASADDNIRLISGYSNSVLQDVLNDKSLSAVEFMLSCLEKYRKISDSFAEELARLRLEV